jgi:cell division protein FtsB
MHYLSLYLKRNPTEKLVFSKNTQSINNINYRINQLNYNHEKIEKNHRTQYRFIGKKSINFTISRQARQ